MADIFRFESAGLGPGAFRVLRFTGTEAVSECYSFELELLSLKEFDIQSLYDSDATFTISRQDGTSTTYRGRVASIGVERMMSGGYFKCRARLVPHLWFYTLRKSCKAYVGKTITDIINAELKENGEGASSGFMPVFDQLPQTVFPLVVKYHETPLEFISRLLQRECLYYYFMAEKGMDMLKFSSDAKLASNETLTAKVINNLTFSSLGVQDERILFKSAHMEQAMRAEPMNLYTYDGNPDSVETLHGIGRTTIEKGMLGPLRGISNLRQSQDNRPAVRYNMATSVRGVRVGIVHDGLRALSLQHDGDQSAAVLESLGLPTDSGQKDFYRNQGLWMPQSDSYIPEWKLNAPLIANATLTGFTTRINTNGTYDVKCHSIDPVTPLPNVRMVFPFAGKKGQASGMHLPLVDGTEVIVEFLEGDPDRPVIMGSLYNTSVDSPVTAINKTDHIIYTPQDNIIRMHDGDVTKITINSPNRVEAISQSEYLVVDSDGKFIEGKSGDHIGFTTGESGDTALLLDGASKHVHLQASGNAYADFFNKDSSIILGTSKSEISINANDTDTIYLKTEAGVEGTFAGSINQIYLKTDSGPSILIGGNTDSIWIETNTGSKIKIAGPEDKIDIETSAGASAIIDGSTDTVELKTLANSRLTMKAGKITMTDGSGQFLKLNEAEVLTSFQQFIKAIGGNAVEVKKANDSTFTYGYKEDMFIGIKNSAELSTGFKLSAGPSLKVKILNEDIDLADVKLRTQDNDNTAMTMKKRIGIFDITYNVTNINMLTRFVSGLIGIN